MLTGCDEGRRATIFFVTDVGVARDADDTVFDGATSDGVSDPGLDGDAAADTGLAKDVGAPLDLGFASDATVDSGVEAPDGGDDAGIVVVDSGVDAGFSVVDAGFDVGVDAGFIVVDSGVDVGFAPVDGGFVIPDSGVDVGFAPVDGGFVIPDSGVDAGFAVPDTGVDAGFARVDAGFAVPDTGVDAGFVIPDTGVDVGFFVADAGFAAVDTGVDVGFAAIDTGVDVGFIIPDTGVDAGFVIPDTGIDVGFAIPDTGVDAGFVIPDTGVDVGFVVPDAGFAIPDTGVDVGFAAVDAGFAVVDAGFVVPDTGVAVPDAGFVPDAGGSVDAGTNLPRPGSIRFVANAPRAYDYGRQLLLPPTFGIGEFTFEVWIRPDNSFPVGSTASGVAQRTNWNNDDFRPYSRADWWFPGNFLLDGHNNNAFSLGTFSLQFYGGGRVRWLFGDGTVPLQGGLWAAQAHPASNTPSLLDGAWHHVVCVRRWRAPNAAQLELWVDGVQVDVEPINSRTDMTTYWNTWQGFGAAQAGWFWGVEKQAAVGILSQYEDYKGLVAEIRFWSVARASSDLSATAHTRAVSSSAPGLVGWFRFDEGQGTQACDTLDRTRCMPLTNPPTNVWSTDAPVLTP